MVQADAERPIERTRHGGSDTASYQGTPVGRPTAKPEGSRFESFAAGDGGSDAARLHSTCCCLPAAPGPAALASTVPDRRVSVRNERWAHGPRPAIEVVISPRHIGRSTAFPSRRSARSEPAFRDSGSGEGNRELKTVPVNSEDRRRFCNCRNEVASPHPLLTASATTSAAESVGGADVV